MLFWSFLSCVVLLQDAICSDLERKSSSKNENLTQQNLAETNAYMYHHPPLPDLNERNEFRKEKSLNIKEQNPSTLNRKHSRVIRRRVRPKTTAPSLEIPVQVIYDTEPTTVRSSRKSSISPADRTTRTLVSRRQSNENKKIDIRQTSKGKSSIETVDVTESVQMLADKAKSDVSATTEFPKRSRGSYFKKRTGPPAPKVKILQEKNFVFAHSGNFHYSFLDADGTKISSEGSLRSYDNNKTGEAVSGSVFYTDKDGTDYSLSYTADENGYRPVGAHLPTPPPLPPAIARALKYIADKSTPSPLDKNE